MVFGGAAFKKLEGLNVGILKFFPNNINRIAGEAVVANPNFMSA